MGARLNTYARHALEFDGEYSVIPDYMQESLREYVNTGRLSGDFLRAVLTNNLYDAVGRADANNRPLIPVYVRWLYNRAPGVCFGSIDEVRAWVAHRGLAGLENE